MDEDEFEVIDVYSGDDSTIYYDNDGEQHCSANVEENS